jgi:hypothetical protein
VEREGWRKTRGGEERKGREQGEEREGEDKRREGRVKGPQDVWQIAAPVTYQFVRRFCVVQYALLDIIALCLINY